MSREHGRRRGPFRYLLRLLPFDFRAEFGAEMEAAFEEHRRDALETGGPRQSASISVATVVDTVRLALVEHADQLRQDLRFGVRTAFRNPGFTAIAVFTLALGIGAVSAVFAVVDTVVFRPLPFPNSDRLVHLDVVRNRPGGFNIPSFSYPQYEDVRHESTVFSDVAAYCGAGSITLAGNRGTLAAAHASVSLFHVLGTQPVIGRAFTASEENGQAPLVAVITYRAWVNQFAADPNIVGRMLTTGSANLGSTQPVTIVGVLPQAFQFPTFEGPNQVDAWIPAIPGVRSPPGSIPRGTARWSVVARLADGARLDAAREQLNVIARRLAAAYPEYHRDSGLRAVTLQDYVVGDARLPLLFFFGAVTCLLLIACVNVANLLLARTRTREREFGIRTALGAGRLRVIRQMLTETTLLACVGGVIGLVFAHIGVRTFVAVSPSVPRLAQAHIDLRVLVFTVVTVAFTAIVAGLIPVFQWSRRNVVDALTAASGAGVTGHRRTDGVLDLLVVAELSLALVLLVGGGLMMSSFAHLLGADLGFDRRNVMTGDIVGSSLPPSPSGGLTYAACIEHERKTGAVALTARQRRRVTLNDEIVRRIGTLPGVEAVGLGSTVPFPEARGRNGIRLEGDTDTARRRIAAEMMTATPGYFKALDIHLVAGRWFDERDREGAPRVAVVSETLARICWPGKNALGRKIANGGNPFATVVGIVRDNLRQGPLDQPAPDFYQPDSQDAQASKLIIKLAAGSPALFAGAIERQVRAVDPGLHVGRVDVVDHLLWERLVGPRFMAFVLAAFSLVALALALVGVHGVLAYTVARRTREIGIRMALGATPGQVMLMVLFRAGRTAFVGVVGGLVGGVAVGRILRAMLFQVAPTDVATLVGASLVLLATVVLAAYGPARQATRVDPATCLRQE